MISVIIPIYNEERILKVNALFFQRLSRQVELIFVDGESTDRSVGLAANYSKVLHCVKGRAVQMNYGAKKARYDTLLFLHVDAFISPRRWENKGIVKTTIIYNLISLLFRLGYPLKKIKLLYDDLR